MVKKDRIPEIHFYEWSVSRWRDSLTFKQLDVTGKGIYRELLDQCYVQGSIPKEPALQALIAGCTVEQLTAVWPHIGRHFLAHKKDSSKLVNAQAEMQRRNILSTYKINRVNGSKGGRPKQVIRKPTAINQLETARLEGENPKEKEREEKEREVKRSDAPVSAHTNKNPSLPPAPLEIPAGLNSQERSHKKLEWVRTTMFREKYGEEFDVWYERQYARHPKKGDKQIGMQYVVEKICDGRLDPALFEKRHIAWCDSEDWKWKGGVKVKQTVAMWTADDGWLYEPPKQREAEADAAFYDQADREWQEKEKQLRSQRS